MHAGPNLTKPYTGNLGGWELTLFAGLAKKVHGHVVFQGHSSSSPSSRCGYVDDHARCPNVVCCFSKAFELLRGVPHVQVNVTCLFPKARGDSSFVLRV